MKPIKYSDEAEICRNCTNGYRRSNYRDGHPDCPIECLKDIREYGGTYRRADDTCSLFSHRE